MKKLENILVIINIILFIWIVANNWNRPSYPVIGSEGMGIVSSVSNDLEMEANKLLNR